MPSNRTPIAQALAVASVLALTTVASADPLIETIYLEGEPLNEAETIPRFVAPAPFVLGDVVRDLGQRIIRTLPNGGFMGVVNTNPQQLGIGAFPSPNSRASGISYLFGSDDRGVTPRAFAREATIGDLEQLEFTSSTAIDYAGDVSYNANLRDPSNPQISLLSSLWENETPILIEGDLITTGPLTDFFVNGVSSAYRTPGGETRWLASLATTPDDGDTVITALMRDTATFDVMLRSGDTAPGLGVIEVGGLTNANWSSLGTNYILKVDVEPGFTSTDEAIAVNGAAVFMDGGGLVREGQTIATVDGGLPDEVWTGFQGLDVNELGDVAFGAFTSGPDGADDVLVLDGKVVHREGDIVDGVELTGGVQGVALNDLGDLAFVWSETLFINGQKVAEIGTQVDTDGDGATDAAISGRAFALSQLEITNLPAADGDGLPVVYFAAEVTGARTAYHRFAMPTLPGDYNGDNRVDAADYTTYRDTLGSDFLLAADGNQDNVINGGDYDAWVAAFGSGVGSAAGVPEPNSLTCCLLAFLAGRILPRPRR